MMHKTCSINYGILADLKKKHFLQLILTKKKNLSFDKISPQSSRLLFLSFLFNLYLLWLGIWCESLVWVIMGQRGVSQNAGILVVLVIVLMPSRALGDAWWRHQMETFSALLILCTGIHRPQGDFLAQRPVTRNFNIFYIFFDLHLNNCHAGDWDPIVLIITSL